MNILFFTAGLGLGGTERASIDIALYFKKHYHRNVYFLSFFDGERRKELEAGSVPISFCNYTNQNTILHELIKKYDIGVLYVWMVGWESIDTKGLEHILKLNEVIFSGGYSTIPDKNICISHALRHKISLIHPDAKTDMVYFPFDSKRRDEAQKRCLSTSLRKQYNIPNNLFLVGRIARPELTKRGRNFITTMRYILQKDNYIGLVLVGLPRLYKLFLLPYHKKIRYFPTSGNDKKLAQVYTLLDCYYHTAEVGETFGMVLAEAMYFGLPVISHSTHFKKNGIVSNHIDNSQIELIEHEINGYISNDKKAIYQRIQHLQHDHNYRDIIAHRNKEKVKQYYDIEKVSAILYDLIYQHTHSDQLSSQSIYEQALHKISHNNRYKYDEPMSIIILKKIYSIVRVIMRKIGLDIEQYWITKDFT